jgi:hypothetical protein
MTYAAWKIPLSLAVVLGAAFGFAEIGVESSAYNDTKRNIEALLAPAPEKRCLPRRRRWPLHDAV